MHRASKVVAEMKAAELPPRSSCRRVSAACVLLPADFDTGVTWNAIKILLVRFQNEMCNGSFSAKFKLPSPSNDMKVMWKANEMRVDNYECPSCTDSTIIKHECSNSIIPSEIRLMKCTETHAHAHVKRASQSGLARA